LRRGSRVGGLDVEHRQPQPQVELELVVGRLHVHAQRIERLVVLAQFVIGA